MAETALWKFVGSEQAKRYHSITFFPYEDDRNKLTSDLYTWLRSLAESANPSEYIKGKMINTWDDWHLIPTSRPVVNPPDPKTNTIEVPGSSSSLDMSEALVPYPTYKDRSGSFSFYVENGFKDWDDMYSIIMARLHNKKMRFILNDDPAFFYEGRTSVDRWSSDKARSTIVISYTVGPYKKDVFSSTESVLWDMFNLRDGIDLGNMFVGSYSDTGIPQGIHADKPNRTYTQFPSNPAEWTTISEYEYDENKYSNEVIGPIAVNPTIAVRFYSGANKPLQIYTYNPDVDNWLTPFTSGQNPEYHTLKSIGDYSSVGTWQYVRDPEIILSGFSIRTNAAYYEVWLQGGNGSGTSPYTSVCIIFRRGRL